MKVHGTFVLDAAPAAVYEAICDPGTLMAVIPGCEGIERTGPSDYRGRIALRLPGVVGSYRTHVSLIDLVPPESAGLDGTVEGPLGSIRGRADFSLGSRGKGTLLEYRGSAVIDGPLARLDSRFVESLAESLIGQGLRALDRRLASTQPDAVAVARPSTEASE